MPCMDTRLTAEQEQTKKLELKRLERALAAGSVRVKRTMVGNRERVTFEGWKTDRTGPTHWHDDCAYRTLLSQGSSALRMAMSRQSTDRMARQVIQ